MEFNATVEKKVRISPEEKEENKVKVTNVVIIGLGYVGLPLAVALARNFSVTGFDINDERITQLKNGFDYTREVDEKALLNSKLKLSSNLEDIAGQDIYIVTVPTPVTQDNLPDLSPLEKASYTVGRALRKKQGQNGTLNGPIVVYESTVYPGVTEDICSPILEKVSGLKSGHDFFLGYSPERMNPGDKYHTVEHITKVVSGQTPVVAELLRTLYGSINNNNIFVAKDIKTAEAAKVIENAQRDINIAFINEIATIVGKLNLSIYDVLDAAYTKWNFIKFQPGLVGGHCIGVDPYYLAHCARKLNHEPEVILSGRRTNEKMGIFIASVIDEKLQAIAQLFNRDSNDTNCSNLHGINDSKGNNTQKRILILGLTFKEDIPDLRNTKVIDVINELKAKGHEVDVHDAMANPREAKSLLNIDLLENLDEASEYDCVVGAVPHRHYLGFEMDDFNRLLSFNGLIADIKYMWRNLRNVELPEGIHYWSL